MLRQRSLLSVCISVAIVLSFGMAAAPVSAVSRSRTPQEAIQCGLWSGSNFDISGKCRANQNPPATPPATGVQYAALGDSVAAGLGLPADQNSGVCRRSSQGYPNMVAKTAGKQLVNASCSEATFGDLTTRQSVDGPDIPAQLNTAFANGTPGLITITAGANDVHWAEFIRACYAFDCTRSSYELAARAYLASLRLKMKYALSDIYARSSAHPPQVVVTGYYSPFSLSCAHTQQGITRPELDWLAAQSSRLNQALRETGQKYSFVRFVPISFGGHDICSADSWVQGPDDPAPFHPTAEGQQAIAWAVISAIR